MLSDRMVKTCTKCHTQKSLGEFDPSDRNRTGYFPRCKGCERGRFSEYRRLNPEKRRQYDLKKKFGITLVQYNQLFTEQTGSCALCDKHQSEQRKAMAVDHDHKTGEIRALLCHNCNVGLGNFQDNQDLLQKAINYLNKQAFTGLKVITGGGN